MMAPIYLKEFILSIVSPSPLYYLHVSPTTTCLGFWSFNLTSLILPPSFIVCRPTMLFISCGDLTHSAVSSAYRKFEIDLPPISAPDSVICVPYKRKIIFFEYCLIHTFNTVCIGR